jgi:hypothetical protein
MGRASRHDQPPCLGRGEAPVGQPLCRDLLAAQREPRRSGAKVFQQVPRVNSERQNATRNPPELLLLPCRSRARCRPRELFTGEPIVRSRPEARLRARAPAMPQAPRGLPLSAELSAFALGYARRLVGPRQFSLISKAPADDAAGMPDGGSSNAAASD